MQPVEQTINVQPEQQPEQPQAPQRPVQQQPAQAAGKAAGKGFPRPAPPAKGRGKVGPPPGPPKGVGKAGSSRFGTARAPPPELMAPAGAARLQVPGALDSAAGTFWEGLGLWRPEDGSGILEGTVIDYEALFSQWAAMPEPPQRAHMRRGRAALPSQLAMQAGVAVRSNRFTPELVRRALTEDVEVLTPDQAAALDHLVQLVATAEPHLQTWVQQFGVQSLDEDAAVLWAISGIPLFRERAAVCREWHHLHEDDDHEYDLMSRATSLMSDLTTSQAMKTVFQTLLIVRNVLKQSGHAAYSLQTGGLGTERVARHAPSVLDPDTGVVAPTDLGWLRSQCPSVLQFVARSLDETRARRSRLRFMRMLAVGRLLPEDAVRSLTWSFLDDLQECPTDAVTTLRLCDARPFSNDVLGWLDRRGRLLAGLRDSRIRLLLERADANSRLAGQLVSFQAMVAASLQANRRRRTALLEIGRRICQLGGEANVDPRQRLDVAGSILHRLRQFGTSLAEEMAALRARRDSERHVAQRGHGDPERKARAWAPVDTRQATLLLTRDLDLIRTLRGTGAAASAPSARDTLGRGAAGPQAEDGAAGAESEEVPAESEAPTPHVDLVHGGLEGVYRRDPITGKWGQRLDAVDGTALTDLGLGGPRPAA